MTLNPGDIIFALLQKPKFRAKALEVAKLPHVEGADSDVGWDLGLYMGEPQAQVVFTPAGGDVFYPNGEPSPWSLWLDEAVGDHPDLYAFFGLLYVEESASLVPAYRSRDGWVKLDIPAFDPAAPDALDTLIQAFQALEGAEPTV